MRMLFERNCSVNQEKKQKKLLLKHTMQPFLNLLPQEIKLAISLSNYQRRSWIESLPNFLQKKRKKESVRVISSQKLSDKAKKSIRAKLKDRTVFFEQDKSLGAGLKIILDDSIIDLTFSGYITRVLEQLKA